ncbi:MAG: hypothetical protein ORN21_02075 [Methylophilaceae bacterium]|nr:hypothetical protein [Methylophilaceae bacterium]
MQCKASATQEARPIHEIGESPSSAPQSHSPVQTVLSFLNKSKHQLSKA